MLNKNSAKNKEAEQLPFASLVPIAPQIKNIFWQYFQEIREVFYELAALDSYSYPLLNMQSFSF